MTRSRTRSRRLGASAVIFGSILIVIAGTTVALAALFVRPLDAGSASIPADMHEGHIVVMAADGDRCKQLKFDNDTGRIDQDATPCDNNNKVIFDKTGAPVPVGTVRRLDAISRSFLAH